MNHDFIPIPQSTEDKCIECGYPENKHGNNAACDCCDKTGNLEPYLLGNSQALLTRDCMEREKTILTAEVNSAEGRRKMDLFQSPENQENRLLAYNNITRPYEHLIAEARKIDDQLHLSSDIFTAKTVPIEELRKAIWNNSDIPQDKKFFEFVAECKRRITHLQSVIFEHDKAKIEAYSEQKAWHVAMNDYANKLRKDEREQLRITDVTYDVKMPKPITPKAIKVNPKKASRVELRDAVNKLNQECGTEFKEFQIEGTQVAKGWSLEQTIDHFRRMLKEGLSEIK